MCAEQDLSAQELRANRCADRLLSNPPPSGSSHCPMPTQIAAKSVETADALFKAKEVSRSDTLLAEIELKCRIINRNSRNRYVAAWQTLATVVGIPELMPQPVSGDPEQLGPEYTWEQVAPDVLGRSPELAALIEIKRAQAAYERVRGSRSQCAISGTDQRPRQRHWWTARRCRAGADAVSTL